MCACFCGQRSAIGLKYRRLFRASPGPPLTLRAFAAFAGPQDLLTRCARRFSLGCAHYGRDRYQYEAARLQRLGDVVAVGIVRDAIDRAVTLFPVLADRQQQRAGSLSGGEQQMLGLARALAVMPRLIIADEMSLGLAPASIAVV